ncbi:pyruvate carboxylase [Bradyrhizobium sp. AUGA SZCCT0431]|uniref:pyruvate carboxylase n=1 Tax=Bradyrhizobium sp. AUGA SZCCT0431 TaxID=2807674 RepID=UPI001BAB2B04|nr:pyruvate carboxylase [Bradyrhizobium sp. AUGA SZCCT0431]MBR1146169.1 pyruvate carboxylase [Bradyrhizobium sp. AUGA SZCCT0431]
MTPVPPDHLSIRRLLVANRSEIAIRVFRAATELGIRTFGVYADADKLSLHRFKADEAYPLDRDKGPLEAYLSIEDVIRIAKDHSIDAIHPGYGFLSESPEFADACAANKILFIGPSPATMRTLGNKIAARTLAVSCGIAVMPASAPLPDDPGMILAAADAIGYPVMIKASWGGGGRGMRPIENRAQLVDAVLSAKREAKSAFGKDEVYLEKLMRKPRHVEVQILGDCHGNLVHLFERDCSIQRRNQKVVERAPAPFLSAAAREALCASAIKIGRASNYCSAGTVEFLMDADTGKFFFIEVNPRIQVEHTVTEMVTGLDIVKAQIRIAAGGRIGDAAETGIPSQADIRLSGHAVQCRITTENPANGFIPDHGKITAYRGAMGFGIRVDGGTAYAGAMVTPFYDPMLEKVTAWAPTSGEAVDRMARALNEYRIRGVATNLAFLHNVITHPRFRANDYTTRFIDETLELFDFGKRKDRATKLLTWIADVTVNGHPDTRGRARPVAEARAPEIPAFKNSPQDGTRQILQRLGPAGFATWMKSQTRVLVTDTTMRDAHQSLLATRVRTRDIAAIAPAYAAGLPQLLSLECWGGATFDVAMRFLSEDPWERLARIRAQVPNILTQMLLRGANGVGYANYPDNVVRHFIGQAARAGMDLFRIFDCLNWVENMRVSIDAVLDSGKLAEGAICYTGDILDPSRAKYPLKYYVALAKELEAAGVHILGLKDMAGLMKPSAARLLIRVLKEETGLPIHFHTHDTSGLGGATILAAAEAGVDAVDAAIDAMSGTTSQPTLGSVVAALAQTERDTCLDVDAVRRISFYWQAVRARYSAFESDLKGGASEVYLHEMPGGQFTNLIEQARSLGLEARWHEVAKAYRAANDMFGDIVKVTPSSKVVGDMALMMVSQGLTAQNVMDPDREIAFPASVVDMLRGNLGQPPGGWPPSLQAKVLKGETPIMQRPGSLLPLADLALERIEAERVCGRALEDTEFATYLMYPKIFAEFDRSRQKYGPVSVLPTDVFFYGVKIGHEAAFEIEDGKTLVVRLISVGQIRSDGQVKVLFELNGCPRFITVPDRSATTAAKVRAKAQDGNIGHIAAPMPGIVSTVNVTKGQRVKSGDALLCVEAMKMETVLVAPCDGRVAEILVSPGVQVEARDLLVAILETDWSHESGGQKAASEARILS